ncbi:MAG: hypothetical protein ACQESR_30605 [Planctomycetota bacterium]
MERCPTQAVLPLVGLAAEKVIRDQYITNPATSSLYKHTVLLIGVDVGVGPAPGSRAFCGTGGILPSITYCLCAIATSQRGSRPCSPPAGRETPRQMLGRAL